MARNRKVPSDKTLIQLKSLGIGPVSVARRFDCSYDAIRRHYQRLGLTEGAKRRLEHITTPEHLQKLRDTGLKRKEIANRLNCSVQAVDRMIRRFDIERIYYHPDSAFYFKRKIEAIFAKNR